VISVDALGVMTPHPRARGRVVALTENLDRDKLRPMPDDCRRSKYLETLYWCGAMHDQFGFGTINNEQPKNVRDFAEMTQRLRQALLNAGSKYNNESLRNLHCVLVHHAADTLHWETDEKQLLHFYIPLGTSMDAIQASIERKLIDEDVIIDEARHSIGL